MNDTACSFMLARSIKLYSLEKLTDVALRPAIMAVSYLTRKSSCTKYKAMEVEYLTVLPNKQS